jgi:hypothetical protein
MPWPGAGSNISYQAAQHREAGEQYRGRAIGCRQSDSGATGKRQRSDRDAGTKAAMMMAAEKKMPWLTVQPCRRGEQRFGAASVDSIRTLLPPSSLAASSG